jgi:PEGA domain-containing protein
MSRVLAVVACGVTLAACSASLPSLDIFKSTPSTEQLRIESEPPGADARTSQGQSCRTPCELTVPSNADFTVTVALNGYQPQTIPVIPETPPADRGGDTAAPTPHLQPNPVYVELQATTPARKRPAPAAKKKTSETPRQQAATPAPTQAVAPRGRAPDPTADYPWPAPQ